MKLNPSQISVLLHVLRNLILSNGIFSMSYLLSPGTVGVSTLPCRIYVVQLIKARTHRQNGERKVCIVALDARTWKGFNETQGDVPPSFSNLRRRHFEPEQCSRFAVSFAVSLVCITTNTLRELPRGIHVIVGHFAV